MIKQTTYGWVDLSNIPKKGKVFDWMNAVGATIELRYSDCNYVIRITKYIDYNHIWVSLDGYTDTVMSSSSIIAGKFGRILGKRVHDFRYRVGEVVNNTLLITSTYREGYKKCYNYKCLVDGYEGHILESNLRKGVGCSVCVNRTVKQGVNDIATTNPEIAKLFYDINDTIKYTAYSGKHVYFKCPRCGCKIKACISNVTQRGLSCSKCGDGISYPNKFVYNFMEQISNLYNSKEMPLEFTPEKNFPWSTNFEHENKKLAGKKTYDMYVDTYNIIIENQGNCHYQDCFSYLGDTRSLTEIKENDAIKKHLAISNGIEESHYIVLDCYKSDMLYIKQSIMSSNLPMLLNFTEYDIDWELCDKFATSSRIFEVCALWNDGLHSIKDIAVQTKLSRVTVHKYLHRGEELGILQDPPKHRKSYKTKRLKLIRDVNDKILT